MPTKSYTARYLSIPLVLSTKKGVEFPELLRAITEAKTHIQ